ncbi:phosphotransferase family protein [Nonomuraea zeae]|nr:phosphotransferase [Nonomuraea zeae]
MTATDPHATHDVEVRAEVVIKRYRSWDRREPQREWTALTRLHSAVPVARLPEPAAWTPRKALAHVRARAAQGPDVGEDPRAAKAFAAGTSWLAGPDPDRLADDPFPPVLGPGDNNLANYLWDAATAEVRIVDWEDSGAGDRAFELADLAEHISRLDGHLDADRLLTLLDLPPAQAARVRGFRRLLALSWLLMLGPRGPFAARNPPGTLGRQAERVLELLGG